VVSWRFGAVGLLVRAIMTPLVGLAVVFGTAVLLEHRRVLRLVSVLSWVGAATLVVLMGVFGLDLVEFRGLVRPESSLAFDTSGGMVLAKLLAVSAVLSTFGVSGSRAARRLRKGADENPADRMAFRARPARGGAADVEGSAEPGNQPG
jgi:hypothetical protein